MVRGLMFASIAAALLSAFALYVISYQTSAIADNNRRLEENITGLDRSIAVLRAERSYLMRPDRLEPLARQLGMRPAAAGQHRTRSELDARPRPR